MEEFTSETLFIIDWKAKEFLIILIKKNMKGSIKITKKMDLEFTILIRIKNTKAILHMDL